MLEFLMRLFEPALYYFQSKYAISTGAVILICLLIIFSLAFSFFYAIKFRVLLIKYIAKRLKDD